MIAPGTYAVLAPLIGGFTVGPRFLTGLLAGAIASAVGDHDPTHSEFGTLVDERPDAPRWQIFAVSAKK